ncbi:RNA polymerase sigma factor [Nocardiopsis changdeensis]|uniref:RNA polymerase sigma factor n=1 Tax=Nocardiopsis changdeensis TaxID=2831969 RepID=A0ABX8BLN6_9ACTN|nr:MULTISPECIES: RNA polymerase sigma factor [Nocardiopsis]QUX23147.1 RNA polymerase sigma factor [Nocardiopsis changdeensis]QYX39090.1 RNA polymerase sigma factor [Nocardiopsis sp. MT53]
MSHTDTRRAVEAVWRIESARLVAALTRMVGDVGLAEEFAQDALVSALEKWPREGVPDRPGAWLTTVAKRRVVDRWRRDERFQDRMAELGRQVVENDGQGGFDAVLEEDYGDDLLRLMFVCCHPVLSTQARVALTLRMLGGLTTEEIARAFLVPESTVAQRIVRAKRTLAEKKVPFEVPVGGDRDARVASVLEVVYLVFNEGYAATSGDSLLRPELCEEAMRLGRVLAGLLPEEREVHGLLALMELHASRFRARVAPDGSPVPLAEQDRSRWDRMLITRGMASLLRSLPPDPARPRGPYALQAAIAAEHARVLDPGDTDWTVISALYLALARQTGSPVVELNRAVAVSMAHGPAAALEIVDSLEGALDGYHLLPSVRGDLLERLGREKEAEAEFRRAASLTRNESERSLLLARADRLARSPTVSLRGVITAEDED